MLEYRVGCTLQIRVCYLSFVDNGTQMGIIYWKCFLAYCLLVVTMVA